MKHPTADTRPDCDLRGEPGEFSKFLENDWSSSYSLGPANFAHQII